MSYGDFGKGVAFGGKGAAFAPPGFSPSGLAGSGFAERNERLDFMGHPNAMKSGDDFNILPQPYTPLYSPGKGGSKGVFNAYGDKQNPDRIYLPPPGIPGALPMGKGNTPMTPMMPGRPDGMQQTVQAALFNGISPLGYPGSPPPPPVGYPGSSSAEYPGSGALRSAGASTNIGHSSSPVPGAYLAPFPMSMSSMSASTATSTDPTSATKEQGPGAAALGSFFAAAKAAEEKPSALSSLMTWSANCKKTLDKHAEYTSLTNASTDPASVESGLSSLGSLRTNVRMKKRLASDSKVSISDSIKSLIGKVKDEADAKDKLEERKMREAGQEARGRASSPKKNNSLFGGRLGSGISSMSLKRPWEEEEKEKEKSPPRIGLGMRRKRICVEEKTEKMEKDEASKSSLNKKDGALSSVSSSFFAKIKDMGFTPKAAAKSHHRRGII